MPRSGRHGCPHRPEPTQPRKNLPQPPPGGDPAGQVHTFSTTKGITTGISAHDRAKTVQTAVAKNATPDQLSQPGHIFPIMSQPGGVLTRAGHTEAGCDLARLAGFEAAATIVEILNEDGSMARRPDLESFSKKHNIKIGTIADLIRYRLEKERYVEPLLSEGRNGHLDFLGLYHREGKRTFF